MLSPRGGLFTEYSALPPPRILAIFCSILLLWILSTWSISNFTVRKCENVGGLGSCQREIGAGGRKETRLPILYFVAGVEGSGHDFMEAFFEALPNRINIQQFEPGLHLIANERQGTGGEGATKCPKLPYAQGVSGFGLSVAQRLAQAKEGDSDVSTSPMDGHKVIYVRARDPFPMGRVRTPLARPDLGSLALFHGIQYDLKVIALMRNLSSVVDWSVTRGYHANDVGLQVRLVEDSMVYLDAALRQLPCGTLGVVQVDMLQSNPEGTYLQLAKFLQLPGVMDNKVLVALKLAKSTIESVADSVDLSFNGEPLHSFFTRKELMWPLMTACSSTPFFSPGSPGEWP